ncbi:MAG: hypothetical protein JWL92_487 [Candidatus Nomurabacteria bacterium]|nr:hypothetical protein [Candidatus Nomurabacteria bacterium]
MNNNYCLNCKASTLNPKFCSRSCSAKYTNKIPKRKRSATSTCECGLWKNNRNSKCSVCFQSRNESATIADWTYSNPSVPQSLYGRIRLNARRVTRKLPKVCSICGYNKHVQVAHIRPISKFTQTTLISEVNDFKNLSFLCPNHHWEFDHGLFTEIRSLDNSIVPTEGFAPSSNP